MYRISSNKESIISEVSRWENGQWRWELGWCRNLRERELCTINELMLCINIVKLQQNKEDLWSWTGAINEIYNTKAVYHKEQETNTEKEGKAAAFTRLWKSLHQEECKQMYGKL